MYTESQQHWARELLKARDRLDKARDEAPEPRTGWWVEWYDDQYIPASNKLRVVLPLFYNELGMPVETDPHTYLPLAREVAGQESDMSGHKNYV